MNENEKIKNLFISQRQALGFTQTEVGAVIGASKSSYSRYERVGFGGVSFSDFIKLCKKLELDPFSLQAVIDSGASSATNEAAVLSNLLGLLGYKTQVVGENRILLYDSDDCPVFDFDSSRFIENVKDYAAFLVYKEVRF